MQGGSRGRCYGAGAFALSCSPSLRPVGSLVYERRESLMLGAAVGVVGIGVGLLIALLGS